MAKYIDQSAAIARLSHLEVTKPTATMTAAKRALADMFPADVAPVVHGRWVRIGDDKRGRGGIFRCSACDKCFPHTSKFCPNCGAKMDL